MTFLTVYTPTYKRPQLLAECKRSVAAQDLACQHVIVEDKVGLGVGGMFADIRRHVGKVTGRYVMVLSDDNLLTDPQVASGMREQAERDDPEVIVFKGDILGTVQPLVWKNTPRETKIDLSCFAVRRDIWVANADKWGHRYEGDYDFIRSLWDQGFYFRWWDRLCFRAQRISNGEPE